MTTHDPILTVKGVGAAAAEKLAVLGIKTVGDAIAYYPKRYEDYATITPLQEIHPGLVTIRARINSPKGRYVRRGMHITEAIATDGHESVRLTWFNQPYRANAIKTGEEYFISGNYALSHGKFVIQSPSVELVQDFPVNTARIIPVYRETKGVTSKQLRKIMREVVPVIDALSETLPVWLVKQEKLISYAAAIKSIHFPQSLADLEAARKRLGFEEVFQLSLASLLNKYELLQDTSLAIPFNHMLAREFVGHLPFQLTDAQRRVVWHIYTDMQKTQPMNRLVEGDVGSGKTVVAAMAAVMPLAEGFQVALMAPTELLARQHANTLYSLLKPLQMHEHVGLLVGGMTAKEKAQLHERIAARDVRFIVGTHALIQDKVDISKLGLVIIDEQHRFGVDQRKRLMAKAGHMPHMLSLTATPIPRSLALTLYGELDISLLDVKPGGRKPIVTEIVSPNSRQQLYASIDDEIAQGRQVFVVCPLITESASISANSAEATYELLQKRHFKHRRVGLLHGKMKAEEKSEIMQQFVDHKLDILVSTTVIEVGVDVPNASVMLIETADRFGLAQIHQLRGRVGRGEHQAYCYLMMSDSGAPPKRLEALERSHDGFKLAELDLELRGPGAIYGTMQHGALDLRIAKLTDVKLIAAARAGAESCIDRQEDLLQYPETYARVRKLRAVTNLN